MADTKISALPAGTTIAGTDVTPGVQAGATVKFTFAQVLAYIKTGLATVATSGAYSDLTGKPSLATVATSGAYADLTGTPTLQKGNVTTTDPGVSNDGTQGYAAGSVWFNTNTGIGWRCESSGTGAAVWIAQMASDFPGYVANNWYAPFNGVLANGTAVAANVMRAIPWVPKSRVTLSALGVRVTTGAASGNCQMAVYASDPTTKKPTGTALLSTASISVASTGSFNATGSASFSPGVLYWLILNSDNATAVFETLSQGSMVLAEMMGGSTQSSSMTTVAFTGYSSAQTFGTWPDVTAFTWAEQASTTQAMIQLKVASVP